MRVLRRSWEIRGGRDGAAAFRGGRKDRSRRTVENQEGKDSRHGIFAARTNRWRRQQCSYFRQHQGSEEEREINNRAEKKQARIAQIANAMEAQSESGERATQNQLHEEINRVRHSDKCRNSADEQEQHAEKNGLAGAAHAALVIAREHVESSAGVIVPAHPSDGE